MAKLHRRDVLLGFGAGVSAFALSRRSAKATRDLLGAADIDALLTSHRVPGVSIAIIESGRPAAALGFGLARGGSGERVSSRTRFQAASITKTVNALAVLKLAEQGRLSLDDAVNRHLKTWNLPDNAFTAERPVTVRMLLSHTGGTTVPGFRGYDRGAPLPTLPQILDGVPPANSAPVRVAWPPGSAFRYSGGGTCVLEQMVIDITGEAYPAALNRLVLAPLGMNQSSVVEPPHERILAEAASGHGADGATIPGSFRIYPEHAAAGLWTTADDLARMVCAILASRNGEPGAFLNPRLAAEMLTPVASGSALGTFVNEEGVFSHPGVNAGFRALYLAHPASRSGIVVMTNSDNGDKLFMPIRRSVAEAHSWPWLLSSSPSP